MILEYFTAGTHAGGVGFIFWRFGLAATLQACREDRWLKPNYSSYIASGMSWRPRVDSDPMK